jgi:hypothetical protein
MHRIDELRMPFRSPARLTLRVIASKVECEAQPGSLLLARQHGLSLAHESHRGAVVGVIF